MNECIVRRLFGIFPSVCIAKIQKIPLTKPTEVQNLMKIERNFMRDFKDEACAHSLLRDFVGLIKRRAVVHFTAPHYVIMIRNQFALVQLSLRYS